MLVYKGNLDDSSIYTFCEWLAFEDLLYSYFVVFLCHGLLVQVSPPVKV